MSTIQIRFHGELNDFLPRAARGALLTRRWQRAAIKDTIEAQGVPHPEVALILVGDVPQPFSYVVAPNDRIEVFPYGADLPAAPLLPPPPARFVLDAHLGTLATRLRLLGFDTLYRNDYDDAELASIAGSTGRILLTRDIGLLKRSAVIYGRFVRNTATEQQVIEVLRHFDLWDAVQPFTRCTRCNGRLQAVAKAAIAHLLPPGTRQEHDRFRRCAQCGQIYWAGSHYARMCHFVARVLAARET